VLRASSCIAGSLPSPLFASSRSRLSVQEALDTTERSSQLPIFDIIDQVRSSLLKKPNLLLEAPPGAGKTTVLPLALLTEERSWNTAAATTVADADADADSSANMITKNVWVVEPRRVAARSAAARMASSLNESPGQTVGYAVRGDAKLSAQHTRITVVTDGVMLNRLREDPELHGIDAICFDEFHERGVGSDTALALSVEIQRSLRPDLRLFVMSATLFDESDGESKLLETLGGIDQCKVLMSDGRQYPIDIQWARKGYPPLGVLLKSRNDLISTMCDAIEEAYIRAPAKGDVLAFLPGAREIERVVQELTSIRRINAEVLPLYGAMSKEKQDYAIFASSRSQRRIIVSSPIAEASLTLEGVTCVVDSGLRREARCDMDTGMPRLVTTRCSKASARQRAGRAGRLQEGLCFRIYSQNEFEALFVDHSPPEILNTDLVPTVLLLSDWGCSRQRDVLDIPFVDPPDPSALDKAYQTLVFLEALEETNDGRYALTDLGRCIAKLPAHPRLATAIVRANSREALAAAVLCASFLDDDTAFRGDTGADMRTRIQNVLESSKNSIGCRNVLQYAGRISNEAKEAVVYFIDNASKRRDLLERIGEVLLPGFIDLVAERKGDASYGGSTYMLSLGRSARLDDTRDSPDYMVVAETSTGDDGIARIRSYVPIDKEALKRIAKEKEVTFAVPSRGYEVRAKRSQMVGALELSSTPLPTPSPEEVTKILLDIIRLQGGIFSAFVQNLPKHKRVELEGLRQRVRLAIVLSSAKDWPACFASLDALESGNATQADMELTESIVEPWLAPAGSLKGIDIVKVLEGTLSPDQCHQLQDEFPLKIEAPDGTQIPIHYFTGTPTASAKLQQFFGTTESPCVGPRSNRLPVCLSLLSPSGKELAKTIDLTFFWRETYPSVRAEMRGRYPKHPWPDDPMNATPTRQTKRQHELLTVTLDESSSDRDSGKKKKVGKQGKRRK